MTTYAESFNSDLYPSNVVKTSGSILLVANVDDISKEPTVKTITVDSGTPAADDTTLDLTADVETTLRKGEVLTFEGSGAEVVVAEETDVSTTASTVNVEPLPDSPPASSETAKTWALLRLLSPTALPVSGESDSVDRKDYTYGLQKEEIKTSTSLSSSVEMINQVGDKAYHSIIFPASMTAQNIFSMIVTGGEHVWGAVQVSSIEDSNEMEEISRPSFDLMFQAPWARVSAFDHLSTEKQDELNKVRNLAGLTSLT